MRVRPTPSPPGSIDDDGKGKDPDKRNCKRAFGVDRADPHSAVKRTNRSDHAEDDHDGRKAKSDGAKGTMPFDVASGDERDLNDEQKHPESEDCSMDVNY